jgi:hypothetical protein
VDASDVALTRPPFSQAIWHWRSLVAVRKPRCIACRTPFAADAVIGGWLFAQPDGANAVSVSAFCSSCWSNLDDAQIEQCAVRVLQRIKPGSKFADAPSDGDADMINREGRTP